MKKSLAQKLFEYRSFTPIPFLILIVMYNQLNIWSLLFGFFIVCIGEVIRLWSVGWLGEKARSTSMFAVAEFIVNGPYAYVRNPLYIANIIIYFGLGFMSFAVFPFLQIISVLFFSVQYYLIVKEEEKFLLENYNMIFEKYSKNVNRFFPKFPKFKVETASSKKFNFKEGLKSEKRTMQAIGFISVTFFLLWFFRRLS